MYSATTSFTFNLESTLLIISGSMTENVVSLNDVGASTKLIIDLKLW